MNTPFCTVIKSIWRKLSAIDVRAFQVPIALCSFFFGVSLVIDPETLHTKSYRMLAIAAPAWAWGIAMVSAGSVLLVGWYCSSRRVSRIGLACATCLWTFVALLFLFAGGASTAVSTYALFSVMSGWALVRLTNGAG